MLKKFLKTTELSGVAVLLLIITAFIRTPEFFRVTDPSTHPIMYGMLVGITVGAILAIVRLYYKIPYQYLILFAILLTGMGTYVFIYMPEYLYTGMVLPLSYWHKVSFMTLPVVCIEGGLVTLFLTLLENGMSYRTKREEKGILIFFCIYSVSMISRSFLTLGGKVPVENHILISQVMAISGIVIAGYAFYLINKPSPRVWE